MFLAPLAWIVLAQVPTTPLAGTVVGPGGEPVAGADLILVGLPSYAVPVVARGKSGDRGEFSLDRPVDLAGDRHPQRAVILWAAKAGFRLSTTHFPEALPRADQPVRVVLEPPGRARVLVEGPDGRPVPGARVLPRRLTPLDTVIPPDIVIEIAATAGPDGVAVLDFVTDGELFYADVHSDAYGLQGHFLRPPGREPRRMALRPVGDVEGRLEADDPALVRWWRVQAYTNASGTDPDEEPSTTGDVETTTDAEGRFILRKIAVGRLGLSLRPPRPLAVLPDIPKGLSVREGAGQPVAIRLKPAATVSGVVVERGTGRLLEDVRVFLHQLDRGESDYEDTDAHGRYTFLALSGAARLSVSQPSSHVEPPGRSWREFAVPEGNRLVEPAPWELVPAAPPIRGEVRDEAGRPVAGAKVVAGWTFAEQGQAGSSGASVEADGRGAFLIEKIYPGADVEITAKQVDRRTERPVVVKAGQTGPVIVAIAPFPARAVAGRVVGPRGGPLGGAKVRLESRVEQDGSPGFPNQVFFEGFQEFKTAPDGTFRTPKELEREPGEYRVEVVAEGFDPARSPWVASGESDVVTLPELALRRSRGVRVVTGRVVDREGKPVAGASVSQAGDGPSRTSARADAEGNFRLPGVGGGEALVFAEAPGFRFGGAIVGGGPEAVEVRLARESEPPIAAWKTLPPPLTRAEERAMARELLAPVLPLARAGLLGAANSEVIPALARVDPGRVLDLIEARVVGGGPTALARVALGQFEDDPASAVSTIGLDLDPASRATAWLALADFRPRPERARLEDLLGRALADARRAGGVEAKIPLLGQVADRWLGLGSLDRARPILLEGQALVNGLPKDFDRPEAETETFGEVLAAIDLPAALDLFEHKGIKNAPQIDPDRLSSHRGRAALRLARFDPGAAEELVDPPASGFQDRPGIALGVARRMVAVDLPRARRLLEAIDDGAEDHHVDPALIPFGLGLMAAGRAEVDPVGARGLLDEAFAGLRKLTLDGKTGQGVESPANLMAELLPATERIDPDRVPERAWLAASCRNPSTRDPKPPEVEASLVLAMLVSRYDRAMARAIAGVAVGRLPDLVGESDGWPSYEPTIFNALAAYDPRAVTAAIRALPESARKPPTKPDAFRAASIEVQFRLAAATILGLPPPARPRAVSRTVRDDPQD